MSKPTDATAPQNGRSFARTAVLAVVLYLLWMVLSGHFDALLLGLGAVSVLTAVWMANRMGVVDREGFPIHLWKGAFTYLPWLGREIVKSNLDVARIILNPKLPISPTMGSYEVTQTTDLGRVILASSITLTPGTITTGVYGNRFEIHALTRSAMDGTEEGEMDRRVARLEG